MLKRLMSCLAPAIASLRDRIRRWMHPSTRPILGYLLARFRSPAALARENALLRKQLEVACRQIVRPRFTRGDRGMLVLLARLCPTWRSATLLVQPETICAGTDKPRLPASRLARMDQVASTAIPSISRLDFARVSGRVTLPCRQRIALL